MLPTTPDAGFVDALIRATADAPHGAPSAA